MLSASTSNIFNLIGTNEIDSFNNTLNEMLTVWNDPSFNSQPQQQQQQQQNQQQQQQQSLSESSNISNILNNGSSYYNLPLPQISLRNSTKGLQQQLRNIMSASNNMKLSASQQLESLFLENSILNNSSNNNSKDDNNINNNNNNSNSNKMQDDNNDILKTINEISIEQKYQPIEITPFKSTSNNSSNVLGQLFNISANQFILDPIKIDEMRFSQTTIDPQLLQPYPQQTQEQQQINGPIRNNGVQRFMAERNTVTDVMQSTTSVGLTKDQLMNFTSGEMKEYVKVANGVKDLNTTEKKELKRQKRLIKNRESAHLSRQRKRERLTELEHKVEELSTNSVSISKTLTNLESENLVLKAEVGQLIEVIKDSPSLCALFYSNLNCNPMAKELLSNV